MAGKMTDIELHYVKSNPENLTEAQLAKKLGRSLNTIKKVLDTEQSIRATALAAETARLVQEEAARIVEEKRLADNPPPKGAVNSRRSFATIKRGEKKVGTVMTAAASELGDEARKQNRIPLSEQLKASIFKPYGDEG